MAPPRSMKQTKLGLKASSAVSPSRIRPVSLERYLNLTRANSPSLEAEMSDAEDDVKSVSSTNSATPRASRAATPVPETASSHPQTPKPTNTQTKFSFQNALQLPSASASPSKPLTVRDRKRQRGNDADDHSNPAPSIFNLRTKEQSISAPYSSDMAQLLGDDAESLEKLSTLFLTSHDCTTRDVLSLLCRSLPVILNELKVLKKEIATLHPQAQYPNPRTEQQQSGTAAPTTTSTDTQEREEATMENEGFTVVRKTRKGKGKAKG